MTDGAFVVVGGDSLVGSGLCEALTRRGLPAYATTRRRETLTNRRIFLDLETTGPPELPPDAGYAYIVAAATNYDRCEQDPLAHRINVVETPRMARALLAQGLFVTFISTNSVFGGQRPWPGEDDPHDPGIAYARQKDEAESLIRAEAADLGAEQRLNVVRLTKILDRTTSPLPAWFATWERCEIVEPFADLIFAPMSVPFVGEALATLGEQRIPGNLHLSGAENVTYVDLAQHLVRHLQVDPELIRPAMAAEKGVEMRFQPRFSGLGMCRTIELAGIQPQPLDDVARDLTGER